MEISFSKRRNRYVPTGVLSSYTRKRLFESSQISNLVFSKEWRFFPLDEGVLQFTNINDNALTADIIIGVNDSYKKVMIGDQIFLYGGSLILDEYGSANQYLCCGIVSSKNDTGGVITLSYIGKNIALSTNYSFYIARQPIKLPYYMIGDCTSGSNVIANVTAEEGIVIGTPSAGITLYSPYFPEGTYIVSASGTNVTVSNNALSSVTGIDVIGANWQGVEYGVYNPEGIDKIAYKSGDIIYNTDFVNYPSVYRWRCIQSGILGTSRLPVFITDYLFSTSSALYTQSSQKTVVSTITETSILNTTIILPANFFRVGKLLRMKLLGFH